MSSVCKLSTLCPVRATFCVTDRRLYFSLCVFKILNDVFKSIELYRQLNIAYVVRLAYRLVYCYRPTEGAELTLTNSPTLTPIEGTSICSLKKDEKRKNLKRKDSWFVVIGGWVVLPHGCGAVSSVTQPAELSLSLDALQQTQKPASKVNLRWWCCS